MIDEVSMINCDMAAEISYKLMEAKGLLGKGVLKTSNLPDWGGVHVVFLGDHYQLPPIARGALYDVNNKKGCLDDKDPTVVKRVQGRLLWERITDVILLDEQMRQQVDAAYVQMLQRLRRGQCSEADWALLQELVIPKGKKIPAEFRDAPIAVVRNPVRTALNMRHAIQHGRTTGQTVLLAVCDDVPALGGTRVKAYYSKSESKLLRRVPDNRTQNLPSVLPLVPGMKYVLRSNEATEFGLANGAECVLEKIVLHEFESPVPDNRDVHQLQYLPRALWLRFPNTRMDKPLTALQDVQVFPVEALTQRCVVTIAKQKFTFSRTQFPLIPSRALTCYASQGKTFSKLLVDLNICADDKAPATAIYVFLSRVKCRHGLRIMRPFPKAVLDRKPPPELIEDDRRLVQVAAETQARYGNLWPERSACNSSQASVVCDGCTLLASKSPTAGSESKETKEAKQDNEVQVVSWSVLEQKKADCGYYARYFNDCFGKICDPPNYLNVLTGAEIPSAFTDRRKFNNTLKTYANHLGTRVTDLKMNIHHDDIIALASRECLIVDEVEGVRMEAERNAAADATMTQISAVLENNGVVCFIVNSSHLGLHWLCVCVYKKDDAYHYIVADSLVSNRQNHVSICTELDQCFRIIRHLPNDISIDVRAVTKVRIV